MIPVQTNPVPLKPELQAHVYDPMVLVQLAVPPVAQAAVPAVHSLISEEKKKKERKENIHQLIDRCSHVVTNSPVQTTPLPEKPAIQAQVKDPMVLVQLEVLVAQLSVFKTHSFTSSV